MTFLLGLALAFAKGAIIGMLVGAVTVLIVTLAERRRP